MDKIKGFSAGEVAELAAEVQKAKEDNGKLSDVFTAFAKKHDRARGSVRNFYYEFMRMCDESPSLSQKFFSDRPHVNRAKAFSEEEEKQLIEKIMDGRRQNKSVRRCIIELAGGDEKLTLRYQNKYRNIIKADRARAFDEQPPAPMRLPGDAMHKLREEINNLLDRVVKPYRDENDRLKRRVVELENETAALRALVKKSGAEPFFSPVNVDTLIN